MKTRSEIDPTFEARRDELHHALLSDSDLQMILHGQIHIEDELKHFIEVAAPSPGKFRKLSYNKRVDVAVRHGLQFGLDEPLRAIGRLRNRFAHEITGISDADPTALDQAFSALSKEITGSCYTKTREKLGPTGRPERIDLLSPKDQCAFYFVAVWAGLLAQTHHLKRQVA
jgi:hypothetical protein